ncbi:CBS domain containing membrane protein [Pyrolobus fumarii 1A]|uniref:CBS domain containing membrane protein n=1 Tax=Pyrolobus fumarii (strain DSM 11204 / 1A) TaxID=694429 RepID=G0EFF7_PYRF1|nr:CBS domain-containing protein [Pyrolobus fumarii]AEM38981.1 CBS domain containing membrane protein [Pyrolobus fumarii 1A]
MPRCHIVGVYPPPAFVDDKSIFYNALRLLSNRFLRQLPVVDSKRRVKAILTVRDVIRFINRIVSEGRSIMDALVQTDVSSVAVRPVETLIYGEFTVHDVFRVMRAKGIGALPVVSRDDRILGLVNEEHLANLIKNNSFIGMGLNVKDIMTRDIVYAPLEGTTVRDAIRLMAEGGFRHLPLVDEERRPVAIVTARDLIRFLVRGETVKLLEAGKDEEVLATPISRVARMHPVHIDASMSLQEALDFMALAGIGGILVVEDGRLAGIITDMDLVTRLPEKLGETFNKLIADIVPPCP